MTPVSISIPIRSFLLVVSIAFSSCGGDGGAPSVDGAPVIDGESADGASPPDAARPDASAPPAFGNPEYDPGGCLTSASAHSVCCERPVSGTDECSGGAGSDPSLCGFLAACGWTDLSQCSIDCVMAPSVFCVTMEMVQCVVDAYLVDSCQDAQSCRGWLLF